MTEPFLRVIRGEPSDEELAALTIVLLGLFAEGTCVASTTPIREQATWPARDRYRNPVSWRQLPRVA